MLLFILQDLQSFENCTGIMIPGSSGIPGWVLHQEMEREVRIELPGKRTTTSWDLFCSVFIKMIMNMI